MSLSHNHKETLRSIRNLRGPAAVGSAGRTGRFDGAVLPCAACLSGSHYPVAFKAVGTHRPGWQGRRKTETKKLKDAGTASFLYLTSLCSEKKWKRLISEPYRKSWETAAGTAGKRHPPCFLQRIQIFQEKGNYKQVNF